MRPRAPSLRVAMVVVALVAFAAAAAGAGVKAAYAERTTADEPHYLVTAISVWSDGDLDVFIRAELERRARGGAVPDQPVPDPAEED